jgi:hypothetical protein
MSGTATSSVFSNDPAKKFDVVFSIDMKQLLSALGASSQQIDKIMATAEANRKKPGAANNPLLMAGGGGGQGAMMMMAGGPGGGGAGMPGAPGVPGAPGAPGAPGQGGDGPRMMSFNRGPGGPGGGGGAGGASGAMGAMSPEQRAKMREVFQKLSSGKSPAEMDEKERAEFQKNMAAELKKAGITLPAGMNPMMMGGRGQRGGGGQGGEGGGGRRGGRGGEGGFGGFGGGAGGQFTQRDLDAAKLPPPPEQDAQLDVLLRPGMLADVEIIVEKIPNAINIPVQAVFERQNKPYVFIKSGQGFQERQILISRRTESTVVVSSGLQAGDVVAMADPMAKPGDKKKKGESKGGAMGALPVGGGSK